MKQKGLAPILIVILIAALTVGGYLIYTQLPKSIAPPRLTIQPTSAPNSTPESSSSAETAYLSIDDKLKNQLGKTLTVIGTPVNMYGPYIKNFVRKNNVREETDSTCLFIDESNLRNIFYQYSTSDMSSTTEVKVSGVVEKEISDFGECGGVKAQCGKHLQYCLKVIGIEPQ